METAIKTNKKSKKNKKNKLHLVFDEEKRKDFLGGFHKRKLQRKKKAEEDLQAQLKEERKRLKKEAQERYKKLVLSHRSIPGIENLFSEEYETENATIKVIELSENNIANENNWIGPNRAQYESDNDVESADEKDQESDTEIPGMDLTTKVEKKPVKEEQTKFNSKKDLKKVLKNQATKNVQKSKAYQIKNKIESRKMRKKSLQLKRRNDKIKSRMGKQKGKKMKK